MTAEGERVAIGGLMRCCMETIRERTEPGAEGAIQKCKYHDRGDSDGMIFLDGVWQWVGPGYGGPMNAFVVMTDLGGPSG